MIKRKPLSFFDIRILDIFCKKTGISINVKESIDKETETVY